ncbi:MAG: PEP-CTERM sorting domain-containing protein, partial [Crocosphaera sp.]|nr:PEP-CTERM sorting domain-containing protein [Crocosphaera sp.]
MTNLFHKFSWITASTVLGLAVISASAVNAASITYDFEVNIDSGVLDGQSYTGFLTFDDSGVKGIDEEFLSITQ